MYFWNLKFVDYVFKFFEMPLQKNVNKNHVFYLKQNLFSNYLQLVMHSGLTS